MAATRAPVSRPLLPIPALVITTLTCAAARSLRLFRRRVARQEGRDEGRRRPSSRSRPTTCRTRT